MLMEISSEWNKNFEVQNFSAIPREKIEWKAKDDHNYYKYLLQKALEIKGCTVLLVGTYHVVYDSSGPVVDEGDSDEIECIWTFEIFLELNSTTLQEWKIPYDHWCDMANRIKMYTKKGIGPCTRVCLRTKMCVEGLEPLLKKPNWCGKYAHLKIDETFRYELDNKS